MSKQHSAEKAARRARGRERRAAGCPGGLKCPCLCHDTGGGAHHHYGRVCDGQPGEYTVIPPGPPPPYMDTPSDHQARVIPPAKSEAL